MAYNSIKCLCLAIFLNILNCGFLFCQTPDKNYVISRTYKVATTSASGNIKNATQQISYLDGLGRPLQSVAAHESSRLLGTTPADLVTHTEYDAYGRVAKVYGPYPAQANGGYQSSADVDAGKFYNNSANFCAPNDRAYMMTEYEMSPLNRVKKQYDIGNDHAVEYIYGVNTSSEVKRYDVSGTTVSQTVNYNANELTFVETKDENGNRVREYKDKLGHVVLKRAYNDTEELSTYYVYDAFSQLRFVLQPQYQSDANLDKFAFKYLYNDRGLVSSKYIPGGGTTLVYYDAQDRLVRTTDGRGKNTYFKYDALNRVIETGEGIIGSGETPLVKTHYDNYTAPFSGVSAFVNVGDGYPTSYRADVKGKATVISKRVVNPSDNPNEAYGDWFTTTMYYDDRYNLIQTVRGLFDLGGTANERITRLVRFDGRLEKERIYQETAQGNHQVDKVFTYDHADRLWNTRYIVKKNDVTQKDIVLSTARYDALGQLKKKLLHSTDGGSNFREQLDYCFTPQSWISKVTGKTSAGDNFGVDLKYANPANGGVAQYNGNIAEMLWRQGSGSWVGYKLSYDRVNRITNSEGVAGNKYRETVSEYDKNGNIRFLQRYFDTDTWDNLSYNYDGNKLLKVTDSGSSDGFNNGASGTSNDYDYDGNGNSIQDLNRGIAANNLKYNFLNLIREVVVGDKTLQYHYDGAGGKLRMSNSNGAANAKYAGLFEYNSAGYLSRIATEEGQVVVTNNGTTYAVNYYLPDQVGNVRMVMNEAGAIIQETEYFAFGLPIPKIAGTNKYLHSGKETQPETGYLDFGARMYMPELGRWFNVDALSEKWSSLSPYNYTLNNPFNLVDPDGNDPKKASENEYYEEEEEVKKKAKELGIGSKYKPQEDGDKGKKDESYEFHSPVVDRVLAAEKRRQAFDPNYARASGQADPDLTIEATAMPVGKFVAWLAKPVVALIRARYLTSIAAKSGGRLGNAATRSQVDNIATTLEGRGYTITGGGGRTAEEYLKPIAGGRRGGSYPDITAVHPNYPTLRINTVDVLTDGVTPTARELRNAARIRTQIAPGEHLILIPKK